MSEARKFDATFKKVPGVLSLTETHVAWVPTAGGMDRQQQALNRVSNMLASKAGSARTSLMLKFKDDVPAGGLLFTFTAASKEADRQAVQDVLIPFVAANRGAPAAAPTPAAPSAVAGPSTGAGPSGIASAVGTPAGSAPGTPGTPSSVARAGKRKLDDGDAEARRRANNLRVRVLRKNPTLMLLHRELVIGKQISEEEFWDGREALLKAEELAYEQRPGRPSRLLDDRFDIAGNKSKSGKIQGGTGVGLKKVETGPIVLNITKDLTREIFEEFPVVQDAYAKNVPRISETDFWTRYFTSTLWERHRASVRKTALDEGSRRKDDIFDAYLEDPDWETAPRKKMPDNVETYLDLAATEEDHGENLVIRDVTMQAGKERSSLPLMRRFNDHSEKLLQAGKKKDASGRSTIPMVADDLYDQIEYEDLRAAAAPAPIPLEVQDANERDDADGARGILPGRNDDELLAMADIESRKIADWSADFTSVCLANPAHPSYPPAADDMEAAATFSTFSFQRDAQMVAGRVVRDMHVASNAEDAVLPPLPNAILEQMRSCHNAATEFLRQYWSAILPAAPGALGAGTQAHSPQVRAARATKMARYLEGTEGKVNAIVTTAEIARVDPDRVRAAMAPTLGAVSVALRREKLRTGVKA